MSFKRLVLAVLCLSLVMVVNTSYATGLKLRTSDGTIKEFIPCVQDSIQSIKSRFASKLPPTVTLDVEVEIVPVNGDGLPGVSENSFTAQLMPSLHNWFTEIVGGQEVELLIRFNPLDQLTFPSDFVLADGERQIHFFFQLIGKLVDEEGIHPIKLNVKQSALLDPTILNVGEAVLDEVEGEPIMIPFALKGAFIFKGRVTIDGVRTLKNRDMEKFIIVQDQPT